MHLESVFFYLETGTIKSSAVITVTSQERRGVSNHRQLDCLLKGLFMQTTMKRSNR